LSTLQIFSYNINGIRAAIKKGLWDWLSATEADVICFQEVKAEQGQVDLSAAKAQGFEHVYWLPAEKKGYSGVAVLSKMAADKVVLGMDMEKYDREGRLIRLDFGDITLINTYMPSGTTGDVRQDFKYEWLDDFYQYMGSLQKSRENLIVCGDFNICPKPIDIHNPQRNKNTSGFLPEEREWVAKLMEAGYTDAFRHFYPNTAHQYTWWSYRANARAKNLGWRIDYFVVSNPLVERLRAAEIHADAKHSDHCPISLTVGL